MNNARVYCGSIICYFSIYIYMYIRIRGQRSTLCTGVSTIVDNLILENQIIESSQTCDILSLQLFGGISFVKDQESFVHC